MLADVIRRASNRKALPQFVGAKSSNTSADGSQQSFPIGVPPVQQGDLLVTALFGGDSTAPGGWVRMPGGGTFPTWWAKIASASTPSSYTWTTTYAGGSAVGTGITFAYRYAKAPASPGDVMVAYGFSSGGAGSDTPTAPSVTAPSEALLITALSSQTRVGYTDAWVTAPVGMTERLAGIGTTFGGSNWPRRLDEQKVQQGATGTRSAKTGRTDSGPSGYSLILIGN